MLAPSTSMALYATWPVRRLSARLAMCPTIRKTVVSTSMSTPETTSALESPSVSASSFSASRT